MKFLKTKMAKLLMQVSLKRVERKKNLYCIKRIKFYTRRKTILKPKTMITLEKIQHPVYTTRLRSKTNSVLFDVRPKRDYLNRYILLWRIMHPDRLKGVYCTKIQQPKVFNSRTDARRFLMDEIINLLV